MVGLICGLLAPDPLLPQTLVDFVFNLFMLPAPSFHHGPPYPLNVAMWSIAYEIAANAAFAIGLFRLNIRAVAAFVAASAAALVIVCVHARELDLGWRYSFTECFGGTARVLFSFFMGVLISRSLPQRNRPTSWMAVLIVMVAAAMLLTPDPHRSAYILQLGFAILVSPALVTMAAKIEPPERLRRIFLLLGDLSYPLYVFHAPTIALWMLLVRTWGWPNAAVGALYLATSLIAAAVLARKYDRWAAGRVSRIFKLRRSAPEQVL